MHNDVRDIDESRAPDAGRAEDYQGGFKGLACFDMLRFHWRAEYITVLYQFVSLSVV